MVWEVLNMNSTEDFRLHYFEATVQFVRKEVVPKRCEVKSNLLTGPGGHFTFHSHHNVSISVPKVIRVHVSGHQRRTVEFIQLEKSR